MKELLKELTDAPKDKPRSLDLFKKFADIKLCEVTDASVKPIINEKLVNREVKESIYHKKKEYPKRDQGRGGFNTNRGRGGYNDLGHGHQFRQQANKEKEKLIKEALAR